MSVPVERAAALKNGLPLQVLSSDGSETLGDDRRRLHFAARRRSDAVGARQGAGAEPGRRAARRRSSSARASSGRRPRAWSCRSPRSLRINGQYFAFVAEDAGRQAGRAKQRAIKVGPIVGDNYPVLDGHQAGRARRRRPARRSSPTARRSRRRPIRPARHLAAGSAQTVARVRRYLHPSSDSRERVLAGHHPRRRDRDPDAADRAVPRAGAAAGARSIAFYNGANAETVETAVTTAARAGDQRRRGHAVHDLDERQRRHRRAITVTFDITRNLDVAAVDVQNRISQAEGRLPNEVKQVGISVTKVSSNFVLAAGRVRRERRVRPALHQQLRRSLRRGRAQARARRRRRHRLRRAPLRDAAVARSRQARRPRHHRRRSGGGAARAERAGGGRRRSAPSRRAKGQTYQISVRAVGPAERSGAVRRHHPQAIDRRRAGPRQGRRPHRARRGELHHGVALQRRATRSASACCSCRPRTRCRSTATSAPSSIACRSASRRG